MTQNELNNPKGPRSIICTQLCTGTRENGRYATHNTIWNTVRPIPWFMWGVPNRHNTSYGVALSYLESGAYPLHLAAFIKAGPKYVIQIMTPYYM